MKRKIFIVGHGFDLLQATNLDFKTRFYVKSGKMLSDNVIPGIIQGLKYPELVANCANWSDKDDAYAYEKDDKGNPSEHIIAITEDDPKPVLICGKYKPVDPNGIVPLNIDQYRLTGTDDSRMFEPEKQEYDLDRKQHLAVHRGLEFVPQTPVTEDTETDLSNHFLVYPVVKDNDRYYHVGNHPEDFIHLSDIINLFADLYPGDTLRFFWLACRSEI